MQAFLINLLIVIGVIWLIKFVLETLNLGEPANKIIIAITLIIGVLWLLFGYIPS